MRKFILLGCLLGCCISLQAQHVLNIKISGIKRVRGKVNLCVVTEKSEFLGNCSIFAEVPVTDNELLFTKSDLKPGTYAVTMYHDSNSNGELDSNFLRIPKERYGFSNNARGTFGPPGYEECLFEVKGDTTISVRLK